MDKRVHILSAKPEVEDLDKAVAFPGINDAWAESIGMLVYQAHETDGDVKRYTEVSTANQRMPKEISEQPEEHKRAFGRLVNEIYDKNAQSFKMEDFVNATSKTVNRFMAEDFLFCNNKLYVDQVDKELFRRLNEFTDKDMLSILVDRVYEHTLKALNQLRAWKNNLDYHLMANPVMDDRSTLDEIYPSITARSSRFSKQIVSLKEQKAKLELDISRLEEEIDMLVKYKTDFKAVFENMRGVYEKSTVDISARIKLFAKHDIERLDKLLFTTHDNRDLIVGITTNKVEQAIVTNIVYRFSNSTLKILQDCLKMLANSVHSRWFSQGQSRIFTRFEVTAPTLRKARVQKECIEPFQVCFRLCESEKKMLETGVEPDPSMFHPSMVNFYEHLLSESGQGTRFFKFACNNRKLSNLMLSQDSMDIIIYSLRLDEQQIAKTLKEFVGIHHHGKIFKEAAQFPDYILDIMVQSIDNFSSETFEATSKLTTDAGDNNIGSSALKETSELLRAPDMLSLWYRLMSSPEKLDNFNQKVHNLFTRVVGKQLEYLDFVDGSTPIQIAVGQEQLFVSNTLMRIKPAFWVREGLLFRQSQQAPNEHHSSILLKEQSRHPHVDNWMQLIINNNMASMNYDLNKFTDEMFARSDVNIDNLKTESRLVSQTVLAYVKLLILRSRTASLKLMSYTNFARSIQKTLSFAFLDLCEQGKETETPLQSDDVRFYRKADFFRQSKMFEWKEFEQLQQVFDDENTFVKSKDTLGFKHFDIKFNRLVNAANFKPFLHTNPSKGGQLGGVLTSMYFKNQEEELAAEEVVEETPQSQHTDEKTPTEDPDNPYSRDKISFLNLNDELSSKGEVGDCPFVEVTDSNGRKVMYDAAIHDFFELTNDLGLLISFFLENDLAYYQDDQFEDLDLQFEEDHEDNNIITQRNVHIKVSKFNEHFNYEYLTTRVLELECLFQSNKTRVCNMLLGLVTQTSDPIQAVKLYDFLSEMLSRRPNLDLLKYRHSNQNTVEWLERLAKPRDPNSTNRGEMTNLITTIFDNYRLEVDYYKDLGDILEDIIAHQDSTALRLEAIMKTFDAFQGLNQPTSNFEDLCPKDNYDLVVSTIKGIEIAGPSLCSSLLAPSYLDRVTFTSFFFDHHYKWQIEDLLGLKMDHETDFLGVLNDYMNGLGSRYKFFLEQSVKRLCLGEVKAMLSFYLEDVALGDDISTFDGEVYPSPEQCFGILNSAYTFFKQQPKPYDLNSFQDDEGVNIADKEGFIQQLNRYFLYLLSFSQAHDIKESLVKSAYVSSVYKAHVALVHPVLSSLQRPARFERPEDMLETCGNLLSQFLDFGDAGTTSGGNFTLDDINQILKEDYGKGSNSSNHLSKLTSLHSLLTAYWFMLSQVTAINSLNDKIVECEASNQLCRILTSKETVFEHLYRFEMVKKSELSDYIRKELRVEFTKVEGSFKSFLYSYDLPFIELLSSIFQTHKKDTLTDLNFVKKSLLENVLRKYTQTVNEENDLDSPDFDRENGENDIANYFTENSLFNQDEAEGSKRIQQGRRRVVRRLVKLEVPSKETKLESVHLIINQIPFVKGAMFLLRRGINYMALWLQTNKLTQSMYDLSLFTSFNPQDIIDYAKDIEFGLSRLPSTIMKALKYKNVKPIDDDLDMLFDTAKHFDEYGSIKFVFKVPSPKNFKEIYVRDIAYLRNKLINKHEEHYFRDLEVFVFKKNMIRLAPKPQEYSIQERIDGSELSLADTERVFVTHEPLEDPTVASKMGLTKTYFESYLRELLLHMRKLKAVEINEINRISASSGHEKQTIAKVLGALQQINYNPKYKNTEFGSFVGFMDLKAPSGPAKVNEIDRSVRACNYDDYWIDEVQETDLFIYYTQTHKMFATVNLKLIEASLDLDNSETVMLQKRAMPFYTLNNLRLAELENLLFHQATQDLKPSDEADDTPSQHQGLDSQTNRSDMNKSSSPSAGEMATRFKLPKFEYRKLRQYLYIVKRIELRNRSNCRPIFAFCEDLKAKMTGILDDAKLTRPDTVFNTYLNCLFENEQRTFSLALLDTIGQLRWHENFQDLIDVNIEKIKNDKELFFETRSLLVNLLFPRNSSFDVFYDIFTNKEHWAANPTSTVPETYPFLSPLTKLFRQLNTGKLKKAVKQNHALNMFGCSLLGQNNPLDAPYQSFNEFAFEEFDMKWESLFTQLLSLRSPQRTFINKKVFQIKLLTERNNSLPEESIVPQNIWIFKMLDANRLLDLNLKNMLLLESLNSNIINDLFCDVEKERSSITMEVKQYNDVKFNVEKRQMVPSLLPFLSNGLFQKEENYEFSRLVLKLLSTELHMTSQMRDEDIRMERYPDVNFETRSEQATSNFLLEAKLKKDIIIEAVWSNNPLHVEPSAEVSARNRNMKALGLLDDAPKKETPPYQRQNYNDYKVEILKATVESLRSSFFMADSSQAFNFCYLLMREFVGQAVKEETARLKLISAKLSMKTSICRERDRMVVNIQRNLLNDVLAHSYLLETSGAGEFLSIRKKDLHSISIHWNDVFINMLREVLQPRENTYQTHIQTMQTEAHHNVKAKELLDFYWAHVMVNLSKVVGSRLVMRNTNFVSELDTLARFKSFANLDSVLVFDKIEARIDSDTRKKILELQQENTKLEGDSAEAAKQLKSSLKLAIEEEKEETLSLMK